MAPPWSELFRKELVDIEIVAAATNPAVGGTAFDYQEWYMYCDTASLIYRLLRSMTVTTMEQRRRCLFMRGSDKGAGEGGTAKVAFPPALKMALMALKTSPLLMTEASVKPAA